VEERNDCIDIITKLYTHLHESDRVMHVSKVSDKKRERIIKYFERLEEVHNMVSDRKTDSAENLLKKYYYDLYVIKPENIPDAYFENEKRIMRERGYGDIELTEERKQILIDQIISDQKDSLNKWIEYFLYDEESKSYEMWEKYWVFQGLQKLGKFDKENCKFAKRDKTTIYPFPPVEREAVFTTLKLMEEYIKNKKGEEEIKSALGSGNFKTLYEYSIKQILQKGDKKGTSTEGKWVKYEQGTDYNLLRDSLQGYYTGWCTAAGENFAKSQLASGDFYVYYSLDENNEPKIPRVAIRMEGKNEIAEIRGIADNQNMEPEMLPILEEKLKEFPDRDEYLKKEHDMKLLTEIERKHKNNEELSTEELRFLYEIDNRISGFGYVKDPRIAEIRNQRSKYRDCATIYNCKEEEIGLCIDDLTKKLKVYCGNLDLSGLTTAEGLKLPETMNGSLYLESLTTAEGLKLPETMNGYLYLNGLTTAEGLKLPETMNGYLHLGSLTTAEGLKLPETMNGSLYLDSLTTAEGLKLPETMNGSLYLESLTTAEGLKLPETMNGDLDLRGLTTAEGLKLPETMNGDLDLRGLTTAEGLKLPETMNGDLQLWRLTTAEGLKLPETMNGYLHLGSLTTAEGLKLPETMNGSLYLDSLTTAEGLKLPANFDLQYLLCAGEIKKEITNHPEKYFQKEENAVENMNDILSYGRSVFSILDQAIEQTMERYNIAENDETRKQFRDKVYEKISQSGDITIITPYNGAREKVEKILGGKDGKIDLELYEVALMVYDNERLEDETIYTGGGESNPEKPRTL